LTTCDDELGADQVLSYRGFWLHRDHTRPAVPLSNGAPDAKQGRPGDIARDMGTVAHAVHQRRGRGLVETVSK
jgi:hypothetical protein